MAQFGAKIVCMYPQYVVDTVFVSLDTSCATVAGDPTEIDCVR